MFIQVIQGRCDDAGEIHRMFDQWMSDLAPTAGGWLGATYGCTDDNDFIGVVRFADKASAAAQSAKPEQAAWWAEAEKCFSGPVTFHDCEDVTMMLGGGSDDAGFVQVIQGKAKDAGKLKAMMTDTDELQRMRPDVIGATLAIEPDGTFTETVAFTTEEAARSGEEQTMSAEMQAEWDEMMAAMSDVHYFDLHRPWFASAR